MIGVGITPAIWKPGDSGPDPVSATDSATRREDMMFTQDVLSDKIHTGEDGTYKYIGAVYFPAGVVPQTLSTMSTITAATFKLTCKSGSGTCSIDIKADVDEPVPSSNSDFDSAEYEDNVNHSVAYPGDDAQITINVKDLIEHILETEELDTDSTITLYLFDDTNGSPQWEFDNPTDSGDVAPTLLIDP